MKGVITGYRRSGDAHRRTWRYVYAYRHTEPHIDMHIGTPRSIETYIHLEIHTDI